MAAITAVELTAGSDGTDQSIYTTASITPGANKLLLLWVMGRDLGGTAEATPVAAGNGLTWVAVESFTFSTIASPNNRATLFRAMGGSPTAGAVDITYLSNQTAVFWHIAEFDNVDISGSNGANAIVQSVVAKSDSESTSFTATLSAFSAAGNATYGAFTSQGATSVTAGTGFALIGTPSAQAEVEFRVDNHVGVDFGFSSGPVAVGAVGVELKASTDVLTTMLTSDKDNVDASVFTTASITPTANRLILLAVVAQPFSGAAVIPTVAGNGLTWVEVANKKFHTIAVPLTSHTLFRAMGGSPSSGTVAITFSGNQKHAAWAIVEMENVDTGGSNGADAVVQSVTATLDGGAGTALSVTLATFSNVNNATFGTAGAMSGNSFTPGSGFTEIVEEVANATVQMQFKATNDTVVDWTNSNSNPMNCFGVEVKNVVQASTGARAAGTAGHLGVMLGW